MNKTSLIAGVALVCVAVMYGAAGITDIDPGEVGLLIKKIGAEDARGMKSEVLDTGTTWIEPITYDVVVYDVKFRQEDLEEGDRGTDANTKDGQPVSMDVSFEVGLEDSKVPMLHEKVGKDYYNRIVFPAARKALREATSNQMSDRVYTGEGRADIEAEMNAFFKKAFGEFGILVTTNIRDIRFTNPQFVQLLEQKAGAAQQVIIQERMAEAAEKAAIKAENEAMGRKLAAIQDAEGQKAKRILEAEAQKEELRLEGEGERLKKEETAKGILAVKQAEAEGQRLLVKAYGEMGSQAVVAVEWARNLGPNVKLYGVPTGAPGTSTFLFDQALRSTTLEAAATSAAVSQGVSENANERKE